MYHKLLAASTLIFSLIRPASAHAQMIYPPPLRSKHAPSGTYAEIDYDMMAPLENGEYPCRGYPRGDSSVLEIQAGSTLNTQFDIGEPHGGGHCQFSISCDGQNFAVIHTIEHNCFLNGSTIPVPIPSDIPNGQCIFSWTWINATSRVPEFYMNCAAVDYVGGSGSSYTGHQPLVANLSGYPQGFSNELTHLLDQTPMITIAGTGQPTNQQVTSHATNPVSREIQTFKQDINVATSLDHNQSSYQADSSKPIGANSETDNPTDQFLADSGIQFTNAVASSVSCSEGTYKCDPSNPNAFFQCDHGSFVALNCLENLICQPNGQKIHCTHPM